jgi:predicted DNA-binding transcriptional regulator AlpA
VNHLVGLTEIADLLGVSRQRAAQIVESYEDFPNPEVELASGRVWASEKVRAWTEAHPSRRSGRPKTNDEMEQ